MDILNFDVENLCFVGDIHGEFKSIAGMMKRTGLENVLYVFCGDCGFGFEKEEYYSQVFNKIGNTANKLNAYCVFVRGNHDSKEYYDSKRINRKRFKTVSDYTVIQTPSHNILCVGGATSIDRISRIETNEKCIQKYLKYHKVSMDEATQKARKEYWPDEFPVYDEGTLDELKDSGIKIDVVATHTSPSFAQPLSKAGIVGWLNKDPILLNDLNYERLVMDNVYNRLIEDKHPLSKWAYGHFHYHNSEFINGINFVMLDKCRNGIMDVLDCR